ncbi:hypothetical protein NSP_7120 [Nodularia spumigena CCY9414]|nr:hypothetical protein NSP_7120 [Nodularia spumigena CCY9414]
MSDRDQTSLSPISTQQFCLLQDCHDCPDLGVFVRKRSVGVVA